MIVKAVSERRLMCYAGFTLIELLVVIAIISLLVSILLPSLNQARELARSAVCLSNTRSLMMAQSLYANDNGVFAGYYPNGNPPIGFIESEYLDGKVFEPWCTDVGSPVNLPPYVCPSEPQAIKTASYGSYGYSGVGQPYGWNMHLGGYFYGGGTPAWEFRGPEKVANPSEVAGWSEVIDQGIFFPPYQCYGSTAVVVMRHDIGGGRANTAFVDGHCGYITDENYDDERTYEP